MMLIHTSRHLQVVAADVDGDAALLLLDHPVHDGGTLVHLTDLVGAARVVEDALGRGGLARVDVGHDPDVADAVEWHLADDRAAALALDRTLSAAISAILFYSSPPGTGGVELPVNTWFVRGAPVPGPGPAALVLRRSRGHYQR